MAEIPHFFKAVPEFVKEDGDNNKIARLSSRDLMLVTVNKNGYAPKRSFFDNVNDKFVRKSYTIYSPRDRYNWDPSEHSIEHGSVDSNSEIQTVVGLFESANALVTLRIGDYILSLSYDLDDKHDITTPIHLEMLVISNSVVQDRYRELRNKGLMTEDEHTNDKHRRAAIKHVLKPLRTLGKLDIEMVGKKFQLTRDEATKMIGIKTSHNEQVLNIEIPEINPSVKQLKDAHFPREGGELVVREPSYLRDVDPLAIFGISINTS